MNSAVYGTKQLYRHNGSNIIVRYTPRLSLLVVTMVVAILWVYLSIDSSRYGNTPQTTNNDISSPFKDTNKKLEEHSNVSSFPAKDQTISEVVRVEKPRNVATEKALSGTQLFNDQVVQEVMQAKRTINVATVANNLTTAYPQLDVILKKAAIRGKTVLVTTLNEAWAKPGSVFDLFLESFHVGMQTEKLLKHLVVITFNRKAHDHCITLRLHCYQLNTRGNDFAGDVIFMTSDYLRLVWKKIEVLGNILRIGYNFLFTDADILWFRNPMKHLRKDADIQMSCDFFAGNSSDLKRNFPNSGFQFVRSNTRTIQFFKFWHVSRRSYPGFKSQDVLNKIKSHPLFYKRRLNFRFLDTALFDGFCSAKLEFDRVCTMHANCCVGLENKVHDLKVILEDWKNYMSLRNLPEKPSVQNARSTHRRCKKSNLIKEAERLLKERQAIVA